MADRTANLSMPFILPSQAQKHVTHNEALQALDAIVQLTVEAEALAPPEVVQEGARFAIGADATGLWAGHGGQIAVMQDGAWSFYRPKDGWLAWFATSGTLKILKDGLWTDLSPDDASFSILGINTAADSHDRLAVASEASLFTHTGHGHQAKINKAAEAEAATLLFQSGWTGHAELGLAGNNDFSIKVNTGTDWLTAMKIGRNGTVTLPQRPTGRAYRDNGVVSQTANSESGFTRLDQDQGGMMLGALINTVEQTLRIPADGLYLMSLIVTTLASSGHSVSLLRNRVQPIFTLRTPVTTAASISHTHVGMLSAGDELTFRHAGTAQIQHSPGTTQLTLAML